jgi:hypothetical protein
MRAVISVTDCKVVRHATVLALCGQAMQSFLKQADTSLLHTFLSIDLMTGYCQLKQR